jgi:carboxymethylenebutenolidase
MKLGKQKLATFLVVLVVLTYTPGVRGAAAEIPFKQLSFESNGKRIPIDLYEPAGDGAHPTILLLYGAGGLVFDGSRMRVAAQRFVRAGYTVYLLHYFNQTRTLAAPPWTMRKNFATWLQTVRESIGWIERQQGSSTPIGIYGFSLGGFLALAVASDNPEVGAVVEQAGGIADEKSQPIGHMPSLLLVHGGRDRWVPFKEYAEPLEVALQEHGIKFETRFFPLEGHKFKPAALEDARAHAINFFRRNLHDGHRYTQRAAEKPR